SLKWTRRQLYISRGIFNKCGPNPWNAFVKQKLDEENEGRAPGDRFKLPAFIKARSSELTSTYLHLTSADKNHLRENINTYRQSHVKVTRANPKTLQKDVNATFKTMQMEQKAYNKHDILNFHVDSGGTVNQRLSLTKLISLCHQLIQDGLGMLSHNSFQKVQMNYDNYEGKIVETYGVAL
ncbi:uncharacterized protein EDB91DRAFT_1017497, partial [Suillus paluster]|uniref:uncharacterized protein n=1 Tax=Suillus paluster TaxID=48578 RepID=UPI001B869D3A